MLRFFRELFDIWSYRAQLSDEIKRTILPPHGFLNIQPNFLVIEDIHLLRNIILETIEKLVYNGINNDSRALGAFYILSALTLVSPEAATAIPWLYQSVL